MLYGHFIIVLESLNDTYRGESQAKVQYKY